MSKKIISPYQNKTLRRAKINNVKCKLTAYQTKAKDPATGYVQPHIVFYYEVSASDGSYHKLYNEQDAINAFENLVEFEKRQMCITV